MQLPLPPQFSIFEILHRIAVNKDVDGFHLYNVGGLVVGDTVFPPCTPYGVVKLLEHEGIPIEGKNVVVVGASNIVGKPIALMLMQRDATVCISHADKGFGAIHYLGRYFGSCCAQAKLILPQMVRTGAVVIDVGINRLPEGRLVGDVDFDEVRRKASYITPVPWGSRPDDGHDAFGEHNLLGGTREKLVLRWHLPADSRSSRYASPRQWAPLHRRCGRRSAMRPNACVGGCI